MLKEIFYDSGKFRNLQRFVWTPIVFCHFRGESEVSSTEVTASEQLQPMPSTAVVSGKRQRDEPQVTDRYVGYIDSSKVGLKRAY